MAATALGGAVGGQSRPFALRHVPAMPVELLRRADLEREFGPQLAKRLHLADHLGSKILRHVAVGAARRDARGVAGVPRSLKLLVDRLPHRVTADAERV